MKKIISIDSSVLRKHRTLKTEQIQLLNELSRLKLIEFYIPEMVYKEVKSQEKHEITECFNKLISSLNTLSKKTLINEKIFSDERDKHENLREKELTLIEDKWEQFVNENNIKLIRLSGVRMTTIIDDYFNGNPPYSVIKSRKDIPDSIIFHSIKELNKQEINFVCCDNALNSALRKDMDITIHESLENLIDSDILKQEIKNIERAYALEEQLRLVIEKEVLLSKWVEDYLLDSLPIELYTQSGNNSRDEDKLVEIEKIESISFDYDKTRLYKSKNMVIPITISLDCKLETIVDKTEFEKESNSPIFDIYIQIIDFEVVSDKVIVREDYNGTLTSTITIDISKPFELTRKKVIFADIRKKFLISSASINRVFDNMTKKK